MPISNSELKQRLVYFLGYRGFTSKSQLLWPDVNDIFQLLCTEVGLLQLLACSNDVIQILDFNVNSSMLSLDLGVMTSTFPHCVMWMQKGFKPKHHGSQSKLQAIHL